MSNDHYAGIVTRLVPSAELKAAARLAGGVSADVHRLDLNLVDGRSTCLVLRAHGASHFGHPAELEYQLLQALAPDGMSVPVPLFVDVSGNLLADPFLVMSFVKGTSEIPIAQESQYVDTMADVLA